MKKRLLSLSFIYAIGIQLATANSWCVPGWNITCNNRGSCSPTTNTCQCDKLPFRCGSQTKSTNVFDFSNRCASITHGCFYELTPGGEVSQHLCNNRGCCASLSEHGYTCKCDVGYTGKDCEKKDPCYISLPGETQLVKRNCSNHGTCHPSPTDDGTAFCRCEPGYSGGECENTKTGATGMQGRSEPRIDDPNHPCWDYSHPQEPARWRNCTDHGSCIRGDPRGKTNYTCECLYGYWSRDCQYSNLCKIDENGVPREPNQPCNGGFCHNTSWGTVHNQAHNSFTCKCSHNQLGRCCEFLNPCIVSPCQHGGVCSYTNNAVRKCKCEFGYSGDSCENRDPCTVLDTTGELIRKPRECHHRGKCSVIAGGTDFLCTCRVGFWGKECEFANLCIVDESGNHRPANKPCNGGKCHNISGFPWWTDEDFFCEFPDPCTATPCQNGGSCSIKHPDPNYSPIQICKCPDGYIGHHCEHRNPCIDTPCQSGGTCTIDLSNQSKPPIQICECKNHTAGQRCEYPDPCTTTPCENGGTCSITQPDPNEPPIQACKCPSGYIGKLCEHDDPCAPAPCLNGGICLVNHSDPTQAPTKDCSCPDEYIGQHCEIVNPCYVESSTTTDLVPRECNNRGDCKITVNGTDVSYECNCTYGYWSKDCTYTNLCQIDETGVMRPPNKPCNGGTCNNESIAFGGYDFDYFTCTCPDDKLGDFCQFPNPCTVSPCQNGGNCVISNPTDPAEPPSRNCTCRHEYAGETCNLPSPCYLPPITNGSEPTVPRDCNNRGDCMVVANGTDFVCNCTLGFWGAQCNFTDLCKVDQTGTVRPPDEPCNSGACSNSSIAVNGQANDTFTCSCPYDKVGQFCQFPNPCIVSPCQNGGKCTIKYPTDPDEPPTRNCTCRDAYVGETCNLQNPCYIFPTNGPDPTVPRDCNNKGDCMVVDNGTEFHCNCSQGFWGSQCNFTNLCIITEDGTTRPPDQPCNGGACNNKSIEVNQTVNNTFTCSCPTDKVGEFCQFPNPCTVSPCQNGGICLVNHSDPNQSPTKDCSCPVEYIGQHCEIVNPCYVESATTTDLVPRECNNHGDCKITVNGTDFSYECNCRYGYWSKDCQHTNLCQIEETGTIRPPNEPCNGGTCRNHSWGSTFVPAQNSFDCECDCNKTGQFCQFPNPCIVSPCLNGGNCTINNQADPNIAPTTNCTCRDEYAGDTCNLPSPCYLPPTSGSDPTIPRDCNNQGDCMVVDNGTAFICKCAEGVWGPQCNFTDLCMVYENGTDRPPNKPCNGGACHNQSIEVNGVVNNTFKCICPNETAGQLCEFPNPCFGMPCEHGGICSVSQLSPNKPPIEACNCSNGYVGRHCEYVDPCTSTPCINGGACSINQSAIDEPPLQICTCPDGYLGWRCEFVNPCTAGVCHNGGTCVINRPDPTQPPTQTCNCTLEFVGKYCQFVNPCTDTPCQHGGSCTLHQPDPNRPPILNCKCLDGFLGQRCEYTDPCTTTPCENGGSCLVSHPDPNNPPIPNCKCAPGYVSQHCEFVDPCVDTPCQNGAACTINQHTPTTPPFQNCNCTHGYVGQHCEYVDSCTATPCQNGGTCSLKQPDPSTKPTQNCTCPNEYVGEHCQLVSPCYVESPTTTDLVPKECNNHGDCKITGNGTDFSYECNCQYGYWFKDCQHINLCQINETGAIRPPNEPCNGGTCRNHSLGSAFVPAQNSFDCECDCNKTGQFCQFPNPCTVSPCLNGGNCTINNQTDPDIAPTRNCTCRDEYAGETCNLPSPCYLPPTNGIVPTVPMDCNNQGDCMVVDNGMNFLCNCSQGFWGPHCNFTDLCKIDNNGTARPPGKPCNGGVCRNESVEVNGMLNNTFTCTCSNDAVGQLCQFPNPCLGMPCKNGGTCKVNQTDPNQKPNKNCTCLDTHIGENCQIISPCYFTSPSDDLVPHDCNERGNCSLTADQSSFICNCQHGFWGRECEFINLCLTDEDGNIRAPDKPCNGGTCHNMSHWVNANVGHVVENTFTCKCPADRLGMFCEFEHPCLVSPCVNGGTCRLSQMTPASVPTRICLCPEGYFGDRCEQINPCYFDPFYCQNSAICVREDNYTISCNCSRPYFQGDKCETVNLCKAPADCEMFNGGMEYCNPCKNGGECISNSTDAMNIAYTCNCSQSNFGGEFCEYSKGNIIIIPEDYENLPTAYHVQKFTATTGHPHNFFVVALVLGNDPEVDIYTGDGFSMRLYKNSFLPVDRSILALSAINTKGAHYFSFRHSYAKCPRYCKIEAVLKNSGIISSVRDTLIYLTLPHGFPCVPSTGLRNVGHVVNEATVYKRTSRFVVEANLKFECFEDNWLDPLLNTSIQLRFEWNLYKLTHFFPAPSHNNDVHVYKLTPTNEKYLVFEPHVLLEGFYWVECRAIARIGKTEYGNSELGFFKIIENPPRIILKESTTRYVDGDKDIIIDASESVDDSFPEHNPYLIYHWSCESSCTGGPWKGPILTIPRQTFSEGEIIKIRLGVTSSHTKTTSSELINLHIGNGKRLSMRCIRNCEKFNPGDEVVFECIYEINGVRQPVSDTELEWLPTGEVTPTFNIEEEPFMTSVKLPVVKDPAPRAIICREKSHASSAASAKLEFRINMAPIFPPGAFCFITPFRSPLNPAIYLVTRFRIQCNKRFVDPHEPLRYSFYVESDDKLLTKLLGDKLLLNYDTNPKTEEVFLPLGNFHRNPFTSWRMKVILKVTDDLGLSTQLSVYTYIKPPDMGPYDYPTLLENLVYGDKSLMKRRFITGDNQGVLQLQMVVAYGLNRPSIINTLTVEEQHKMLSAMEHTLISVPLHSFKITEQKITAAHFIDHIEDRPATDVLTEVSQIMYQSASQMVEFTKQGEEVVSSEQVDSLARASADSSSRLLRASYSLGSRFSTSQPNFQMFNKRDVYDYHTDDDIGRDYYFEVHDIEDDFHQEGFNEISENLANEDVKKYAKVSHHSLFAFERVMDAAVENLGYEANFFTNTDNVGLHAEVLPKLVADYTAAAYTTDGTSTEVMIPKDLHDILKDKVENDLELQITEVKVNPFYDDSSANPHTPVVNLVLKDSESHVPVLLEDLPYPLDITLFFNPPPSNALDGARTEHEVEILPSNAINENTELMIFKLDLPYDTKVDIEIDKVSSSTMTFKIIALKDHRPTLPNMCSYPLLDVVTPWPKTYQASFNTESLRLDEIAEEPYLEYYIGILPLDPNTAGTKQNFRLLFTRVACLHRDEDRKFWSEEGCIVNTTTDPNANQPILHCSCRHASILTGVQFIAPHYLETANILDFTLEEIQKNPVVLITVCTMLVIYLIGLIICAVYDKRDREKNFGLTIMADLRESNESQFYLITIVTGCNFWAGTTSTVSLILYGSSGRSNTYTLKVESLHVFRRGGIDTFLVSSDKDLGDLEKIRIWIDYSGSDPAWFCRRILVRKLDDNENTKWYFYIHKWFSITDKSTTIIMEIPATTRPERKMFSARFRENLMEQIDNVNLWFSIFRYSPAYTFTRCQRLSCAFAVLTSYLLINIMFYGTFTEDESGFYEVGEFTFDLYAIIKSFQVVILAIPFGVLIITLFRYILPQYIPTLIIWKNAIPAKLSLENKNLFIPKTNDEINYQHTPPRKNDTDSDVKIVFDSDEEEIVPLPGTIRTGVQPKSFDATSNTSSKSNFSIPSTDIPQLEEWLEDRTKQYRGYTAKLVGASSDEDDGDQTEQDYPDKFITTLDEVDEEDRFTNRLERLGRLAIITSVRDYDPDTFIFQGDNDIPQIEALIDEQIKWRRSWTKQKSEKDDDPELNQVEGKGQLETVMDSKTKSEFKKATKTPWKDTITTEYLQKLDETLDEEMEMRHKLQNQRNWKPGVVLEVCLLPPIHTPRCSWPYWFVVISWIVCLLTIFLTCYFTLLYGLHYGYLRSVSWLHSYIRSFLMSALIVQPLNAVIAAFLSTLFGKVNIDSHYVKRTAAAYLNIFFLLCYITGSKSM
ncbi:unnamed protein product [Orchesella dallaii]|uniref:Neurogenic locus Notch protein n=1 Tax=Orchesella dallaii TaxID=48710 RepID=A0ABP1QR57_9HEXA